MTLLTVKNVQKEWYGVTLFEHVSFDMQIGDRVALFGRNGVGKTTLLQGLLGKLSFDAGSVNRQLPLSDWGALEQHPLLDPSLLVLDYVMSGSLERYDLKGRLEQLQMQMEQHSEADENDLNRYGETYERYVQLDGYGWEAKVEKSLRQMRLDESIWRLPFHSLSGGQKTRVQLAALLAREPAFIVLDEPTNHLDGETLLWLEGWVSTYPGTVLYVSHDRTFIDRTATRVLELSSGGARSYSGGYTRYREQKELEARTLAVQAKKQSLEKEKLLESIRRYAEWFNQAHKAARQNDFLRAKSKKNVSRLHAKESALERLERNRVELPRDTPKLRMKLSSEAFSADTLLMMDHVSFAYDTERPLLQQFGLRVQRGDRIAVLGPNGVGKSTLLKLLSGRLKPGSGAIRLHGQTHIGYFAQELEELDESATLLDSLLDLPGMTQTEARTILGCFLFTREEVFKRIGDLSMGERCRLAFLKLYFGRSNLLILDEPTNYLDIDTRERVEEALMAYPGALLVVSHDRYLLRRLANRLVLLAASQKPKLYNGTYEAYFDSSRSRALTGEEQAEEDERARIELQLAQLMGLPTPASEAESSALLSEIRALRKRIGETQRPIVD